MNNELTIEAMVSAMTTALGSGVTSRKYDVEVDSGDITEGATQANIGLGDAGYITVYCAHPKYGTGVGLGSARAQGDLKKAVRAANLRIL